MIFWVPEMFFRKTTNIRALTRALESGQLKNFDHQLYGDWKLTIKKVWSSILWQLNSFSVANPVVTESIFDRHASWGQPECNEKFPCVNPNRHDGCIKTNANVTSDAKWLDDVCFNNPNARE
jgi:hypothetical protein